MHVPAPHPARMTPAQDGAPAPADGTEVGGRRVTKSEVGPLTSDLQSPSSDLRSPSLDLRPPPFQTIIVPAGLPPEQSAPSWILTFKLLERMAKAYTWVGCFLLLAGIAGGWRVFLRPEHLTIFCMSLLLLAISRIRYYSAGLDLRYFMPMVIVGLPWMALGLKYVIAAARRLLERRGELSPRAFRVLAGGLIVVIATCSFLDGPMSAAAYMRKHAAIGRWVFQHAGPSPAIAGTLNHLTLDTYYSNGHVVGSFPLAYCLLVPMRVAIAQQTADVVVLWNEENLPASIFR